MPKGPRGCGTLLSGSHVGLSMACNLRSISLLPFAMVTISATYSGNKKCSLVHPAGATLKTDAPKDIGGDASAFSPTDLMAAGLASCILTTIAMYCERNGIVIGNPTAVVEKHMSVPPAPRRISRLPAYVELPASIPPELRERIEKVGYACPVHASLPSDIEKPITYKYI